MLETIVSGGQTGVDQAAWRAARTVGLATAGLMPKGFKTEQGPRPDFAHHYNATEHPSPDYPPRTRANVQTSHATLIVVPSGGQKSPGTQLTIRTCEEQLAKYRVVHLWLSEVEPTVAWIIENDIRILNVAGPRSSSCPGIGKAAEGWLEEVFREVMGRQRGESNDIRRDDCLYS